MDLTVYFIYSDICSHNSDFSPVQFWLYFSELEEQKYQLWDKKLQLPFLFIYFILITWWKWASKFDSILDSFQVIIESIKCNGME